MVYLFYIPHQSIRQKVKIKGFGTHRRCYLVAAQRSVLCMHAARSAVCESCRASARESYVDDTDSHIDRNLRISALVFTILLWGFYYTGRRFYYSLRGQK